MKWCCPNLILLSIFLVKMHWNWHLKWKIGLCSQMHGIIIIGLEGTLRFYRSPRYPIKRQLKPLLCTLDPNNNKLFFLSVIKYNMKIQNYLVPLNLFLSHKDYFGLIPKPMPNLIMAVTLGSILKLTETNKFKL